MADHAPRAQVFVLAGVDRARSFDLGERAVLGRSSECEVVLQDRSISRKHAVIVCRERRWFLQDLGSTNGIHKDGKRVERVELRDGDEFQLGDLPLRLRLASTGQARDDGIEFASPLDFPPAGASPAPSPQPVPASGAGEDEEEVEIEMEVEIEAPAQQGHEAMAGTTFSAPPRAARRTGLFSGDLEQFPGWIRALLVLGLLVVGAGLCYGAFLAVQALRAGP
jgi:hypothetical protein